MRLAYSVVLATIVLAVGGPAPAPAAVVEPIAGPQSGVNGVVVGQDGNLWAAEAFTNSVVRLTPGGSVLNRYTVGADPSTVTTGPGNRVWVAVTGADKLVWFDATAASPTAHDVPTGMGCGPVALVAAAGRMFFSRPTDGGCGGSMIGSVPDSGTGALGFSLAGGGTVLDLAVSGGKLFAPDFDGDVVRRLSLAPDPVVEATITAPPGSQPDGIAADGSGGLWVTAWSTGRVLRFPATAPDASAAQVITPTGGTLINPFGIVAAADGRIYVTGKGSANLLRITPSGLETKFVSLPGSAPFTITDGLDGDLVIADQMASRLLRYLSGPPRAVTAASAVTGPTTATADATVNPRGETTQVVFDYGTTAALGSTSAAVTVPAGTAAVPVRASLTGLAPATTYRVRVRATNVEGATSGAETTFTTPAAPVVGPPATLPTTLPGIPLRKRLDATTTFVVRAGRTTVIRRLELKRLLGGETLTLRCSGARCPFKTRIFSKLKAGTRTFGVSVFTRRRLPAGTRFTARVTAPGLLGRSTVLTVRRGRKPSIVKACVTSATAARTRSCG